MTKQLFNGWIDGSVEPECGCRAVVYTGYYFVCDYELEYKSWFLYGDTRPLGRGQCIRYFPLPPHDKLMTTGSTVLEAGDE